MASKKAKKKTKKKKVEVDKTYVLSVRIPVADLVRLDRYVESLQRDHPGAKWSRSSAGLNLILTGLDVHGGRGE
jgi:hypothetical protein